MPKLRRLSGKELIAIFARFGFTEVSRRGSHVKLRRTLAGAARQTLTIPAHAELDLGTLAAIYRQALRYVPDSALRPHFFSD